MNKALLYSSIVGIGALCLIAAVWFFLLRPQQGTVTTDANVPGSLFGDDTANTAGNSNRSGTTAVNGTQAINTSPLSPQEKIFKINDGPIVGATLIQTLRPTTTIARYIRQDDGHVFDVPLGVAGAVPRVVSNVTIPGGQRALWVENGNAALLQYVDDSDVVKTVYLGFPAATTSGAILPTRLQFLPDNITAIAASPDGQSVAYLLPTSDGVDGYISKPSGLNSKKIFSMQLSELQLYWPAQNNLLVESNAATGVQGIVFSVNPTTGAVSQLLSAPGLTAIANRAFSEVVYGKSDSTSRFTFAYNIKNSSNKLLALTPIPEKCIWGLKQEGDLYCAVPVQYVDPSYLDWWHQGVAAASDGIYLYDLLSNNSMEVASPGSSEGGVASDIFEMALSPDEHYLTYTTKTARTLWGVVLVK